MSKCDVNDIPKVGSTDPKEVIEIVGGNKIRVELETTSNKNIYTIHYQEYLPPVITVGYSGAVAKVGTTVEEAIIAGSINEGSETIVERTMTPDKGLSLTAPISYIETNVTGTTPGLWPRYSGVPTVFTAKDSTGFVVSKQVGVEFRYPFYMAYSTKDILVTNDDLLNGPNTTEDLLTTILSKYSSYLYNYSAVPVYIYWIFPANTPGFTSAQEGAQNVPLKLDCDPIEITIPEVGNVLYKVIRTALKTRFTALDPIKLS